MEIKELKIYTNKLSNQIDFYSKLIGLELIEYSANMGIFQLGKSKLHIVKRDNFTPYHFAINIPCNKEDEALEWLKERIEILKDGNTEIQDFDFWNAKAIYFYDSDKNIVEFIARKNLKNDSKEAFNVNSLIEISEIGVPVKDIETTYQSVHEITDIEIFDGGFERFCALGDEHGLFICINKQVKDWFPTGDTAHSSEFQITIIQNGREYELEFLHEKIQEVVN